MAQNLKVTKHQVLKSISGVPSSSRVITLLMPMLSEGSSSGLTSSRSSWVQRWGRLAGVSLSVHPHVPMMSVYPRCITHFSIGTLRRPDPVQRRFGFAGTRTWR